MTKITVKAGMAFDGEYELDLETRPLYGFDYHIIKVVAGVLPLQYDEALAGGDYDLMIALTVIAMFRAGTVPRERFKQAADELLHSEEPGAISVSLDDAEAESDPPKAQENDSAESESNGSASASSGQSSSAPGGVPASILTPTGQLGSVTGSG